MLTLYQEIVDGTVGGTVGGMVDGLVDVGLVE